MKYNTLHKRRNISLISIYLSPHISYNNTIYMSHICLLNIPGTRPLASRASTPQTPPSQITLPHSLASQVKVMAWMV